MAPRSDARSGDRYPVRGGDGRSLQRHGAEHREFNYQGGDRKAFYGRFPFDGSAPDAWNAQGVEMSTNDSDAENVLTDFTNRLTLNVEYFLVGRHFGFVPYFFPGVVAVALWLFSAERQAVARAHHARRRRFGSGAAGDRPVHLERGGGPPGNRHFMSVYAAMLFPDAAAHVAVPPLLAWTGGALLYGQDPRQPVRRGQVSESDDRAWLRTASTGRADDGERPADHARRYPGPRVVRATS